MARFDPILDVVRDLCYRNEDFLQRKKGLYLNCAKDTWLDLNLTTVKMAKREVFQINKRLNSIDFPCDFLKLSAINIIDRHGCFIPVFKNDSLHGKMVDVGAVKDCACEFNCGYKLCNTVKGYEAVVSVKSDKLPNGDTISFNCVDRKSIDPNGFFYSETQYPLRVYTDGVWTNTVLHTERTKLCAVEIDTNGCICDTDDNVNKLCHACGIEVAGIPVGGDANSFHGDPRVDTWIYHCNSKLDWFSTQCGSHGFGRGRNHNFNHIYNVDESSNRFIFPPNFGHDRVMVRYYHDISLKNIQVPFLAKECFMTGLQYFANTNNDKKQQLANVYEMKYSKQKFALTQELNKRRIEEMRMMLTPPVKVPSYIDHRHDRNWSIW